MRVIRNLANDECNDDELHHLADRERHTKPTPILAPCRLFTHPVEHTLPDSGQTSSVIICMQTEKSYHFASEFVTALSKPSGD